MAGGLGLGREVANVGSLLAHRHTIEHLLEPSARSSDARGHQGNIPLGAHNGHALVFRRVQLQETLQLSMGCLDALAQGLDVRGRIGTQTGVIVQLDAGRCTVGHRSCTNLHNVGVVGFKQTLQLRHGARGRTKLRQILRRQRQHERLGFVHTQNAPLKKVRIGIEQWPQVFRHLFPVILCHVTFWHTGPRASLRQVHLHLCRRDGQAVKRQAQKQVRPMHGVRRVKILR